jgi:acyl-CoA thioesterase-1
MFALAVLVAGLCAAEPTPAAKTTPRPPDPALASITDVPGLPRVLLLGDSISIGYTLPVRACLQARANVHRPTENCGDTARGLQRLDAWLGGGRWDVIHFNFGLHDLKYLDEKGALVAPDKGRQVASLAEYEKNLHAIVARLRKTGARLIFATTTPVPAGSSGRVEHDEVRYNEVAVRVMKELGVAVDDLHAFVGPRQAQIQRAKNVHFTDDGYAQLADVVVASVAPARPPAKE